MGSPGWRAHQKSSSKAQAFLMRIRGSELMRLSRLCPWRNLRLFVIESEVFERPS